MFLFDWIVELYKLLMDDFNYVIIGTEACYGC